MATAHRTALVLAGSVLGLGLIAGGAYWAGSTTTPETEQPSPPQSTSTRPHSSSPAPPEAAPPQPDPSTLPGTTPEAAAVAWLDATNTRSWRDPTPTAWTDRAEPHVTGQAADDVRQARTGNAGPDWQRLVHDRCEQRVTGVASVIPPEAPRTDDVVYVQVHGQIVQECATGEPMEPQPLASTVETRRGPDGTWAVSARLF